MEYMTYPDIYDKTMDLVELRANEVPLQGEDLFTKVGTKADTTFKISDVGSNLGLPMRSEDSAALPRAQPIPGFDESFTPVNYRLALFVTEDTRDVDRHGLVAGMIQGLMKAGLRQKMYAFAAVFNGSFTGYLSSDGMYYFDSARPSPDKTAANWSNLETAGALTHGRYSTARVNLRKRVDERGYVDPAMANRLIVPSDLQQKAIELRKAEFMPENALHQPNWLQNSFDVFVWDYLTSSTAWFIQDTTASQNEKGLWYVERYPLKVAPVSSGDMTTGVVWARYIKVSLDYGPTRIRSMRGNAGS
jgi:hypothetical protein